MTSTSVPESDYRSRFKKLQLVEDKKDFIIEELLIALESISGRHNELKADLETEREARRGLQRTLRDSQPVHERFALLIIHLDPEVFLFEDSWVREPVEGGESMVSVLQEKVLEYLATIMDDVEGIQVIVKVYGDLFKLWQKYEEGGSKLGSSDLTRFFSHFNRSDALVDFMDIGPRRESIERKLSGVVGHYLPDERCEHILLAVPNSSIDPILSPHSAYLSPSSPASSTSRISLIPPLTLASSTSSSRRKSSAPSHSYPTTPLFDSLFTKPSPKPRKKSHDPPPAAPLPPAAAPKLRIRQGLVKQHERNEMSPPRSGGIMRAPSPPVMGSAMVGSGFPGMQYGGVGKWGTGPGGQGMRMQQQHVVGRTSWGGGQMGQSGIPSLRWP